ncbi:MAG: hypothetical protein VB130_12665, partial [Clostridium sp.]|nr:hypothetical protein [Clostridium sp.]
MAKNKSLKVLSTASVAGMVAAAVVSSQAFAAVDAYSVKVDNDVFQYSKADLTDSFLAAKAGEAAPLYEDFLARFEKASGFYAFHDNKTEKYVSVADITEKYLEAKAAGTEFVVDTYTESKDAKVLEVPTVKKVVVKDGKVVIEDNQQQGDLKVESVSAINYKTVTVEFNNEIDKETASKITIYDKDNHEIASTAKLKSDEKTVVCVLTVPVSPSTQITVKVDGVKSKDATKSVDKYEKTLVVVDTTIPAFTSARAINAKQIELQFTEPVNFDKSAFSILSNVKLDGKTVIARAIPNYVNNTVMLEFSDAIAKGTHNLEVVDVPDFANFKTAKASYDVLVEEDTAAPVITSAEIKSKDEILLTFDETVETKGTFKVNGVERTATEVADTNKKQFKISGLNLGIDAVVEVKIEYKGQKDV